MATKISDQEKVQYLVRFVRSSNYGKALDTVKDCMIYDLLNQQSKQNYF